MTGRSIEMIVILTKIIAGRKVKDIMNLSAIKDEFSSHVKSFTKTGNMSDELYSVLFDYYCLSGDMPYGVAKARDGDPIEWVCEEFESYLAV
jgi:hypothetical protein